MVEHKRVVGHRKERPITFSASAEALREGAAFVAALQGSFPRRLTGVPKGVHRFASHAEANRFDEECLAGLMGRTAKRPR